MVMRIKEQSKRGIENRNHHGHIKKKIPIACLMVQCLCLHLPVLGVQVRSLVRKLRCHMAHGQKNQNIKRSTITTNSIKTLKVVHIKKENTWLKTWRMGGNEKIHTLPGTQSTEHAFCILTIKFQISEIFVQAWSSHIFSWLSVFHLENQHVSQITSNVHLMSWLILTSVL